VEVLISCADYEGAEGELTFAEGDFILLMRRDDTGWWQGDISGTVGWLPSNFVRETSDEEFEQYCAQWGIEPYIEEEKPVVAAAPQPKQRAGSRAPEPAKAAPVAAPVVEKKVEKKAVAATPAAPAAAAGSGKCAHCGVAFSVSEAADATTLNEVKLHGKCVAAYRKAKGDTKNPPGYLTVPFGALPNSMDDFEIQGLLGKGRFGKVYQCRKKDTGRVYAIKALLRNHIESSEAQKILVEREKSILMKIKGPFLVRCYHIFEDSEKLYFVMECASGGELFVHLSRERIFDPERVKFYAAEMFLGLEYLHGLGIVYRDLKVR
jgi:hypothetical protein